MKLGELQAREGKLQAAINFFNAAVSVDPENGLAQEQLEAVTRATGDVATADAIAHRELEGYPTSDFLKEELGVADVNHLAADPYRVLRVAAEYMDIGLYQKALEVLTRNYKPVPDDESEPGSVLPQDHPLVMYYAAYCRMKLGENPSADWGKASKLSTSLVFPSTETDRIVLEAALAENQADATAHYLLGTLLFSEGLFDEGMKRWDEAKALAPHMPVVDADLGKAWLFIKYDAARAQRAFIEGLASDPANAEVYVGLDQAMSLTASPATQRAAMLMRYPHADSPQSTMPSNLVYQLALTRAEAGQFPAAFALFKGRFFALKEGGIASDQVLFEIGLMQAEADAASGNCGPAEAFLMKEASSPETASASRTLFKMAGSAQHCGKAEEAVSLLKRAATSNPSPENLPWMIQAEEALDTGDAAQLKVQLSRAIPFPEHLTEIGAYSSRRWYVIGLDQATLGEDAQAETSFRNALLLPDSFMSHHLARAALASLQSTAHRPPVSAASTIDTVAP